MLWRALGHIAHGFYIDVGANEPTADSVTKLLYDRGWRGINIEPLPGYIASLNGERPRDINLQCAVGPHEGHLQLWNCDVRGWATADQRVIAAHRANGFSGHYVRVPMMTLAQVCQAHCSEDIHFLKVDVEGFEHEVLQGMDFARFRPWIVVVEAYRPDSVQGQPTIAAWESILTNNGYSFVFGDGLNRFYLSDAHPELAPALQDPPNVRDGFVRVGIVHGEILAQQAKEFAEHWQARAQEHEERAESEHRNGQHWQARALEQEQRAESEHRNGQYLLSLLALNSAELGRVESCLHASQIQEASIGSQLRLAQAQLNAALTLTEVKIAELEDVGRRLSERELYLNAIKGSRSWRLTGPLRTLARFLRQRLGRETPPAVAVELPTQSKKLHRVTVGGKHHEEVVCSKGDAFFPDFIDQRTRRIFMRLRSAQIEHAEEPK